jgi:hypothetical protein
MLPSPASIITHDVCIFHFDRFIFDMIFALLGISSILLFLGPQDAMEIGLFDLGVE